MLDGCKTYSTSKGRSGGSSRLEILSLGWEEIERRCCVYLDCWNSISKTLLQQIGEWSCSLHVFLGRRREKVENFREMKGEYMHNKIHTMIYPYYQNDAFAMSSNGVGIKWIWNKCTVFCSVYWFFSLFFLWNTCFWFNHKIKYLSIYLYWVKIGVSKIGVSFWGLSNREG